MELKKLNVRQQIIINSIISVLVVSLLMSVYFIYDNYNYFKDDIMEKTKTDLSKIKSSVEEVLDNYVNIMKQINSRTMIRTKMEDYDKEFLNKFMEFFKENISQSDLIIEDFANALNMSRTAFYCKMKSIVGVPPVDFIKQLRIKRAIQLFNAGETSISQVAYLTGFSDPKYFSKCFSAEMNESPSKYLLKNKKHDQEDKKQA